MTYQKSEEVFGWKTNIKEHTENDDINIKGKPGKVKW